MLPNQNYDIAYFQLLQENDPVTWQHLIRTYYPPLCLFAKRILKNEAAAEDVATETFVKFWQKEKEFTDLLQVKKYLYTAVRNGCLNVIRGQKREDERHSTFTNALLCDEDAFEKEVLYTELLAEIRKAIDGFSPRMREIFILSYFKHLTNEQIATTLQLSNQTVRNQKALALTILRKQLKPNFPLRNISLVLIW
ncbi:MAG: RNA polymerase sigma-70 factor [Chitinophagaceae bacterium]|nr:RNA polymerase sigma-70 factor [Chitinophagaceae bacterium]